jgi:hypothetical protein
MFLDVYVINKEEYSSFYKKTYEDYQQHPLFIKINKIKELFLDKEELNDVTNQQLLRTMDDALGLYIFGYWSYNDYEENLNNIKIALLLREYLNLIGWASMKLLANYHILQENQYLMNEEYSTVMLAENLPELIDDFLGIFIKESCNKFESSFSSIKGFLNEFSNVLYNEGMINYILQPVD